MGQNHSSQNKSSMMNYDELPSELRDRKQWVVWRKEDREEKPTKVPHNPNKQGQKAKSNDSSTWSNFQTAFRVLQNGHYDGLGYMFHENDPYTGVDLDHCRDPETGEIEEWAQKIVENLDSYTEVSPSQTGVHTFIKGKLPEGQRRKGQVEMYDTGRFFCMTGEHVEKTPRTIKERQTELEALHAKVFQVNSTRDTPLSESKAHPRSQFTDKEVLSKATQAKNGESFSKLWEGQYSDYPSQSEADLALCKHLVFWVGRDANRIDRLFRQSGLYRQKWDEKHYGNGDTYGERLIKKVLSEVKEFYASGSQDGLSSNSRKTPDPSSLAESFLQQNGLLSPEGLHLRSYREEWFRFDGKIFVPIRSYDLRADVVKYLRLTSAKEKATHTLVKNVVLHLEAMCNIPSSVTFPCRQSEDRWMSQLESVVLNNGIVDLRPVLQGGQGLSVQPHTPQFVSTVSLDFALDPYATCSRWLKFLEEVLPDPKCRQLLCEIFGYCLTYDTSLQKFFVFEGTGANGKGVVLRILTRLLGETNVSSLPLELFGASHGLETTLGKLVNITSELGDANRVAEGFLKQFTGEDQMQFNPKYRASFSAKPTAKLIIATNVRPPFRDRSEGLWRRLILLPFPISVPDEKRNPYLTNELIAELPGIFNWAIKGACDLRRRQRFEEPIVCVDARKEFRRETNPAQIFLEERCILDADHEETTLWVYSAFQEFCKQHGYHPIRESNFGKQMKVVCPRVKRVRRSKDLDGRRDYVYRGIRLL